MLYDIELYGSPMHERQDDECRERRAKPTLAPAHRPGREALAQARDGSLAQVYLSAKDLLGAERRCDGALDEAVAARKLAAPGCHRVERPSVLGPDYSGKYYSVVLRRVNGHGRSLRRGIASQVRPLKPDAVLASARVSNH